MYGTYRLHQYSQEGITGTNSCLRHSGAHVKHRQARTVAICMPYRAYLWWVNGECFMLYLNLDHHHNANLCLNPHMLGHQNVCKEQKQNFGDNFYGFPGRPVLKNTRGRSSRGRDNKKREVRFELHKYDVEYAKPRQKGENVLENMANKY